MTLLKIVAGGACFLLAAATAFGQQNPPPDVKPDKPWIAVLFAVIITTGAVLASVMTPKRTHLD